MSLSLCQTTSVRRKRLKVNSQHMNAAQEPFSDVSGCFFHETSVMKRRPKLRLQTKCVMPIMFGSSDSLGFVIEVAFWNCSRSTIGNSSVHFASTTRYESRETTDRVLTYDSNTLRAPSTLRESFSYNASRCLQKRKTKSVDILQWRMPVNDGTIDTDVTNISMDGTVTVHLR